jgi:hypothetical protein
MILGAVLSPSVALFVVLVGAVDWKEPHASPAPRSSHCARATS